MKILVTGGTGVVGESVVKELDRRGHTVRVLSRHADEEANRWPAGVEPWTGDVTDEHSIRGSAEGCDAILHIVGIVEEKPPVTTFQAVNIDGTRYVVLEAERAGVKKVVYVSSLGADRGTSEYHKSKRVGEEVVATFSRDWVVIRPGAVYGPGDEHISTLVRMVRSLPVLPTIGDGNQQFQPVWHEDVAMVLAEAVERNDVRCAAYDVGGPERTSQNDLVARLRTLTDRPAIQAPVPEILTHWGIRALDAIGVDIPFSEQQLDMLRDGNVVPPERTNALTEIFRVAPTRLDVGLRRLLDAQPEQLPSEGKGPLKRKRFWVDIRGGNYDTEGLFEYLRTHFSELMPPTIRMSAEPNTSSHIEEGATLTMEIPVRGHIQVRVAEVTEHKITLLTLAGHPIAGAVRFLVETRGDAVRFEVQVYDRPASTIDQVMMAAGGAWLQRGSWVSLAENVAQVAGGTATPVETTEDELDEQEAKMIEEWTASLSAQLSRNSTSSGRD